MIALITVITSVTPFITRLERIFKGNVENVNALDILVIFCFTTVARNLK